MALNTFGAICAVAASTGPVAAHTLLSSCELILCLTATGCTEEAVASREHSQVSAP